MLKTQGDFTAILIRRGIVTPQQVEEARKIHHHTGTRLEDVFIQVLRVPFADVLRAVAEFHGLRFLDLTERAIAPEIIELVPESVARENVVIPVAETNGVLTVAVSDPADLDTLQKLQFILNKDIVRVLSPRNQILEAIDRHYGSDEADSVVSMLAEFTDTAIDFGETDSLAESDSCLDLALAEGAAETEKVPCAPAPALAAEPPRRERRPLVDRHATIRYYHRMNPERMFPLLVVISRKAILEVAKRGVSQQQSKQFQVTLDSVVEVEPILPGCCCYPPREQVRIQQGEVTATFWVVPHVLGKVMDARVVVRQDGATLAQAPLEMCVVKQTLTLFMGGLSLLLPVVFMVLKHLRLDFESQLADGFSVYAAVASWAMQSLSPETLAAGLLTVTAGLYLWLRPRKRDVFWDIQTAPMDEPAEPAVQSEDPVKASREWTQLAKLAEVHSDHQAILFGEAERHFADEDYGRAVRFFESGLTLGKARPVIYHHASVAAWKAGDPARALAILQEAAARLAESEMKGAMWYNMGCFATRLGRFVDALRYLKCATEKGYRDVQKYRSDPDLEPLRWRSDFKRLVGSLKVSAS